MSLQPTIYYIPNHFVENRWEAKLAPQSTLAMIYIKTWQKKDGLCRGFDLGIAAEQLHLDKTAIFNRYLPNILATEEMTVNKYSDRFHPKQNWSRHTYQFREHENKPRYFALPKKLLLADMLPERKLVLIILFRLRDKYSYCIRPVMRRNGKVETLYQTLQRCLLVKKRTVMTHIKWLKEKGFLAKTQDGYQLKKHEILTDCWDELPLKKENANETESCCEGACGANQVQSRVEADRRDQPGRHSELDEQVSSSTGGIRVATDVRVGSIEGCEQRDGGAIHREMAPALAGRQDEIW